MKQSRLAVGFGCLVLLGACHVGPVINELPEIREPQGANVVVDINQPGKRQRLKFEGELIEVRDDGLVLALSTTDGRRLSFASWGDVWRVKATEFKGFQSTASSSGERREEGIRKMRLISRFPQGLTPDLFDKMLASYDQQALDPISK